MYSTYIHAYIDTVLLFHFILYTVYIRQYINVCMYNAFIAIVYVDLKINIHRAYVRTAFIIKCHMHAYEMRIHNCLQYSTDYSLFIMNGILCIILVAE